MFLVFVINFVPLRTQSSVPIFTWEQDYWLDCSLPLWTLFFLYQVTSISSLPLLFSATATAKSLQSCLTVCDPIDGSLPGSRPWDSPGKNTGVGCHFLLQRMKVNSESEVAQSCPTLSDLMDCSLPGSSTHGIFQARVLQWGAIAFSVSSLPNSVNLCVFQTVENT